MSTLKVNSIESRTSGTSALTIDASGYLTASQPVLARMVMVGNQADLTDQTFQKLKLDQAIIDTKSGFDNSNDQYVIPVAGYYRIYAQAFIGVNDEAGSIRDSGIVITKTRSSTETQMAYSTNRHRDGGGQDQDDAMVHTYTIDQLEAGDKITVYVYGNTDTNNPYDVFSDIDAGNDNTHLNSGIPGTGGGEGRITYVIVERII